MVDSVGHRAVFLKAFWTLKGCGHGLISRRSRGTSTVTTPLKEINVLSKMSGKKKYIDTGFNFSYQI